MLLIRLARRLKTDERGVALAAVVGLMMVGLLLTSLIMASVIGGLGFTTSTRAGVQSQAAADAGVAVALAGLQTSGSCAAVSGVYTGTDPKFRATVWYPGGAGGWTQGCPPSTATQVRIISTGDAAAAGVAGQSGNNTSYVEASYAVGGAVASGSAIYLYSGGAVNAFSVVSGGSTIGDIRMPTGNFSCTTGSVIEGDVVVAAGDANLTNTCIVKGSVRVSGSVSMTSSAQVWGDVSAAGGGVTLSNTPNLVKGSVFANGAAAIKGTVNGSVEATGAATVSSGALVKGSLLAGGQVRLESSVQGSVTTSSTATTTVTPGGPRVGGDLTVGGDLDTWGYAWNVPSSASTENEKKAYYLKTNGWVVGEIRYQQTGVVGPIPKAAPTVPAWVDWDYKWSDWASAGFVQELTWPAALGCKLDNYNGTNPSSPLYPWVQQLLGIDKPTVINALGCATVEFCNCGSYNLKFKADIAFISHGFVLGAVKFDSFDSTDRKSYFLVPDGRPTVAGRDCNNGAGSVLMYGSSIIGPHLAATIYTPCNISINNASAWRGQLYSGTLSVSAADGLTYVPIGIPGTNLDGASGSTGVPGTLGALVTSRNRPNNGE